MVVVVAVPADLYRSAGMVTHDYAWSYADWPLTQRTEELKRQGVEVRLERGRSGLTAGELAATWQRDGAERVEVVVPFGHERAANILLAETSGVGLATLTVNNDYRGSNDKRHLPSFVNRPWLWTNSPPFTLEPDTDLRLAEHPSPFHAGLHLHSSEWLDLIESMWLRKAPQRLPEWQRLRIAHESRVSPIEAAYAGTTLRERNSDLLVNIL